MSSSVLSSSYYKALDDFMHACVCATTLSIDLNQDTNICADTGLLENGQTIQKSDVAKLFKKLGDAFTFLQIEVEKTGIADGLEEVHSFSESHARAEKIFTDFLASYSR